MVKIFDIKAFDKQPISRVCQASISRIVCVLEHSPFDVSCLAPTTANADNYMKIKVVMLKRLLGGIDYGFGYKLTNCPLWCLGDVLLSLPSNPAIVNGTVVRKGHSKPRPTIVSTETPRTCKFWS